MQLSYDLVHFLAPPRRHHPRVHVSDGGCEASNRGYGFIGIPESHHVCLHHGNNPEAMEKYTKIVTCQVEQFGRFVQKLRDTPDGNGTLFGHALSVEA